MTTLTAHAAEKDAGRKIKYFVRGDMKVSYRQYCAAKAANAVRVNGTPVHADYLLRVGDCISVELPDTPVGKAVAPEPGEVNIAYMDADILIIDKPAPLACQCTPKQPIGHAGELSGNTASAADGISCFAR